LVNQSHTKEHLVAVVLEDLILHGEFIIQDGLDIQIIQMLQTLWVVVLLTVLVVLVVLEILKWEIQESKEEVAVVEDQDKHLLLVEEVVRESVLLSICHNLTLQPNINN
jgi:hypothetical protein